MLFNSLEFAAFFAICFSLYLVLPHRAQNRLLLVASYIFYGAWDWRFLGLILASTIIDYAVGLRLGASSDPHRRRQLVSVSIVANLALLGFFKYAGFFADSLAALASGFGVELSPFTLQVILPVGISFYTFQTLSYSIDIYRGQMEPTRRFFDFALFVAFFPQLVAGPIERARSLLPQVLSPRQITWEKFGSGSWLVFWGIFKKVVIADNLAPLVNAVFADGAEPTGVEVLVACYAFSIEAYCDFSGYSDVARGLARMLGFELMLNFRLPYFTTSTADFWRRWHISLSTWLRDYLYIPLGGNRGNVDRNLFITMVVCGIWHGAGWNYALFGVYHGVLLVLHRHLSPWLGRIAPSGRAARGAWLSVRVLICFQLVNLGWPIFRAESFSQAVALYKALLGPFDPGLAGEWLLPMALLTAPLVLVQIVQLLTGDLERIPRWPVAVRVLIYVAMGLALLLVGEDVGEQYFYFQF